MEKNSTKIRRGLSDMTYEEFGKLRFLDFFPKTDSYYCDDFGSSERGIGMACSEGYAFTNFARPLDLQQTAEIILDFDHSCPEIEGNALLEYLGLSIRKGMPYEQVRRILGTPEPVKANPAHLRFIIGSACPYYVGCFIREREGLSRVWICRKDLAEPV